MINFIKSLFCKCESLKLVGRVHSGTQKEFNKPIFNRYLYRCKYCKQYKSFTYPLEEKDGE